jgi:hypothetical protein
LFDEEASLAVTVCDFVRDGLAQGDVVMLVVTSHHRDAIRKCCDTHGVSFDAACRAGSLIVHDATEIVGQLKRRGELSWASFDASIGVAVRTLLGENRRLRVFGEAVDVLARAGDFHDAERLEQFWNRLAEEAPFTLFCSYMAEHFGNPRDGDALRRICQAHSQIRSDPRDVLSLFLLKTRATC